MGPDEHSPDLVDWGPAGPAPPVRAGFSPESPVHDRIFFQKSGNHRELFFERPISRLAIFGNLRAAGPDFFLKGPPPLRTFLKILKISQQAGPDNAGFREIMMMGIPRTRTEKRWARPDSNRRPPPCKGDVIPLDHEPDNLLMSDSDLLKVSGLGFNVRSITRTVTFRLGTVCIIQQGAGSEAQVTYNELFRLDCDSN